MMNIDDTRPDSPITKPASRWRNWFRCIWNGPVTERSTIKFGDVLPGGNTYPSKDVAESAARHWLLSGTFPNAAPGGAPIPRHDVYRFVASRPDVEETNHG